jgi:hypothetical protein
MIFSETDYENQFNLFAGWDVDWFATDSVGQLAHFTSAGHAPIPSSIVRDDLVKIHQMVLQLPCDFSSEVEIMSDVEVEYYRKMLRDMAGRGFFCFDAAEPDSRIYVCVARPMRPVTLSQLPAALQEILSKAQLDCRFDESRELK